MKHRIEYFFAWAALKLLGWLPHRAARFVCSGLAALSYAVWPNLRRAGSINLRLAFPEQSSRARRKILYGEFQNLGRMLADFAHFPRWNRENIEKVIIYEGFENFARAEKSGNGVIFITAHFGNWELASYAHGVYGHPCNYIARRMDNPLLEALITRYRSASGGKKIEKTEFSRQVLRSLKQGESVGVLMDQNMLPGEGVFVDFFGIPASTTTGPARVVKKTGAAVVLGLAIWDRKLGKYRLRFDAIEWIKRDDPEDEIRANTANFTALIEAYVRRYPDQWLWVHRRWKTRPQGEPPLYP